MQASALLIHFPSRTDRELAALSGRQTGDEVDKFGRCSWEPGALGPPRLTGCSRWIAGAILERVDTGDHVGHLLEPLDAATDGWSGQLGFQAVQDLEPGHGPEPAGAPKQPVVPPAEPLPGLS